MSSTISDGGGDAMGLLSLPERQASPGTSPSPHNPIATYLPASTVGFSLDAVCFVHHILLHSRALFFASAVVSGPVPVLLRCMVFSRALPSSICSRGNEPRRTAGTTIARSL